MSGEAAKASPLSQRSFQATQAIGKRDPSFEVTPTAFLSPSTRLLQTRFALVSRQGIVLSSFVQLRIEFVRNSCRPSCVFLSGCPACLVAKNCRSDFFFLNITYRYYQNATGVKCPPSLWKHFALLFWLTSLFHYPAERCERNFPVWVTQPWAS